MNKIAYPAILLLLLSLSLSGQSDVTIKKSEFKADKKGFDEAWANVRKGDDLFDQGGVMYNDAFESYIKAIAYNNSNPELNYKAGAAALYSDRKEEAAPFLLKAIELRPDVADDAMFLAGRALQFDGRYGEAIDMFNRYLISDVKKPDERVAFANKYMHECNAALLVMKDTLRVQIFNMGPEINSPADDYSGILTADGKNLFFATKRASDGSVGTGMPDENIFVASCDSGTWNRAVLAGKELTTDFCETPLYINKTSDSLYIYAGYEEEGNIKLSTLRKGKWSRPGELNVPLNTLSAETSFCLSGDGNTVFFVSSNRKDNLGGRDIFIMTRIKGNKWSKPVNPGNSVNSEYDEESVRLSPSGDTLWFSSKGHNSIGGFDIFYSVRNSAGQWGKAVNLGFPVNTPRDEIFFYPSPAENNAFFFVSNRSGGLGGLDIYKGTWLPEASEITLGNYGSIDYNADTLINNNQF